MKKKLLITMAVILTMATLVLVACSPAKEETPAETTPPAVSGTQAPEAPTADNAADGTVSAPEDDPVAAPEETVQVSQQVLGEIQELIKEGNDLQIHVTGEEAANPANDIIATITDKTVIVDAASGKPVAADKLKAGDKVQVYVSSAMTKSLPPIANAFAVVTNIPENLLGIPTYLVAEEVTQNDDGSITVLNENKDLLVTIPADMKIGVFGKDGDTVATGAIAKGDTILAWFDMVAQSLPAQATATQAMVVK